MNPVYRVVGDVLQAERKRDDARTDALRDVVLAELDREESRPPGASRTARVGVPWWMVPVAAAIGFVVAMVAFQTPAPGTNGDGEHVAGGNRVAPPDPDARAMVQLTLATGRVEMRDTDGSWRGMTTGATFDGEPLHVRTLPDTKAAFVIHRRDSAGDDHPIQLRLAPATEVHLVDGTRCHLVDGTINTRIGALAPDRPFTMATDELAVDSAAGEIELERYPRGSETRVISRHGTAVVRHPRGGERQLFASQAVTGDGGQLGETRQLRDLQQTSAWLLELISLKGTDDPEFAAMVRDLMASVGDAKSQYMAEHEIRSLGSSCARPLHSFITSDRSLVDPERRRRAARLLADVAARQHLNELLQLLDDADPEVRVQAARGVVRVLGRIPADGATDPPGESTLDQWFGTHATDAQRITRTAAWRAWCAANAAE